MPVLTSSLRTRAAVVVAVAAASLSTVTATTPAQAVPVTPQEQTFTDFHPTVSGAPTVGQTLTASPGDVSPAPTSTTYRWSWYFSKYREDTGQTGSTYVLTEADLGKRLEVEITVARDGYSTTSAASEPTGSVQATPATVGAPTITGATGTKGARILDELTCVASPDTTGSVTYAWSRGGQPLATGSTYTATVDDFYGHVFRREVVVCTVTATPTNGNPVSADADVTVLERAEQSQAEPSLTWTGSSTGTVVGDVLTCTPDPSVKGKVETSLVAYDPRPEASEELRFRTLRDDTSAFTLTNDEVGTLIQCVTYVERDEYDMHDAYVQVGPVTATAPPALRFGRPTITGTTRVGELLQCSPAASTPVDHTVRWTRNGQVVGSQQAYAVQPQDLGRTLVCQVRASAPGYTEGRRAVRSATIAAGTLPERATVVEGLRDGRVEVRRRLVASIASLAPGERVTWQWSVDGVDVAGATSRSFTPSTDLRDRRLAVAARVSRPGYEPRVTPTDVGTVVLRPLVLRLTWASSRQLTFSGHNLVPGQSWSITVDGSPKALAEGRAEGERIDGTVVLPGEPTTRTRLTLVTSGPDRTRTRRLPVEPS